MNFKIDENLPQDVAQLLRENGHDALSVFDQALSGETDPALSEICRKEGRVLIIAIPASLRHQRDLA